MLGLIWRRVVFTDDRRVRVGRCARGVVDAFLMPPGDADATAAAVRRILTEPGLAERLSRNARLKAERHDWSMILPQWERLLKEVAGRG